MQMGAERPLEATAPAQYSLARLVLHFLKLGTIGFGGPIALAGYMKRDHCGVDRVPLAAISGAIAA